MDRAPFLADQHRAGQEVTGAVAHLDGVQHRLREWLVRTELPEGQLRAEQAERQSRHGGQDPRCCGPSALHQAPPPRNIYCLLFQGGGTRSRLRSSRPCYTGVDGADFAEVCSRSLVRRRPCDALRDEVDFCGRGNQRAGGTVLRRRALELPLAALGGSGADRRRLALRPWRPDLVGQRGRLADARPRFARCPNPCFSGPARRLDRRARRSGPAAEALGRAARRERPAAPGTDRLRGRRPRRAVERPRVGKIRTCVVLVGRTPTTRPDRVSPAWWVQEKGAPGSWIAGSARARGEPPAAAPIPWKFLRRRGENERKCALRIRRTVMLQPPAFPSDARHSCSTAFTSSSPATWPSISAPRTR